MSSFTSPLDVRAMSDGINFMLLKKFSYHVGSEHSRHVIRVPSGFVTDFASVPSVLVLWIGVAIAAILFILHLLGIIGVYWTFLPLGIGMLPILLVGAHWGKYGKGAVIHDFLYQLLGGSLNIPWVYDVVIEWAKPNPRKYCDTVFREAIMVGGTPTWKADLMFWGVRAFGWLGWHKKG
jgi:hypothetical protein